MTFHTFNNVNNIGIFVGAEAVHVQLQESHISQPVSRMQRGSLRPHLLILEADYSESVTPALSRGH